MEISKKTAPTIFQVRSSRAIAFQSTFSSFSALKAFVSDLAGFLSGLFFVFFFSLVAMAAKIKHGGQVLPFLLLNLSLQISLLLPFRWGNRIIT